MIYEPHDPRRMMLSPEDRARAESLVAGYGGVLSTSRVEHAPGIAVEWTDPSGYRIAIEGQDAGELLGALTVMLGAHRRQEASAGASEPPLI